MIPEDGDLEVRLRHRVHKGLTLDVALRLGTEIGVLFGPSGAGKTSILKLITGLIRPDSGRVRLGNSVLLDTAARVDLPLRRRRIGMIFQDDLLFPHLTVADNIRFGLKPLRRAASESRLAEVAELCGVEALLGRWPETLSGGERQRVGLARTLAPRPRLLLCDEPVSALDLPSRHALIDRLRAVQRSERIPVLYVTHSPAEAIMLGTRLFLLDAGTIQSEGPPLDVLATARGASFAHLPGIRNALPARVEGHQPDHGLTRLRIEDGPCLVVPMLGEAAGTAVLVEVRSDDILLARGAIAGISAQNLVPGTVAQIVTHGPEAEVVVHTGGAAWIVSVVISAVEQLALAPGASVNMIIKARSCHVRLWGR